VSLSRAFQVGGLRCHTLEGGRQRLDGGAMFGVVPRPLWETRAAPDERHRIPLAMRCLLVEHPDGLVLIDTALGNKQDQRFLDIYGVDNAGLEGATQLEDALATAGFLPRDVRWVINTHLHFDHAGGNTRLRRDGQVEISFPNATYIIKRGEYEYATHPNERTAASYFDRNYTPVEASNKVEFVASEKEIVKGVRVIPTPGHTPFHQSVLIESAGERAFYPGDLVPTHAHLPLPWIMGYDLEPLRTLESRRALYQEALAGDWLFVFEHDPGIATARLQPAGKGVELRDVVMAGAAPVG
jgi:glyoxylase-like metal-dependent hydrolase (beta-lactamase superfamily II)